MRHIINYHTKDYQTDYFNSIEFLCEILKKFELSYDPKSCDDHLKILNQLAIFPDDINILEELIENKNSPVICRKCLESEKIYKYINNGRSDYIDYKLKFAKHKIFLMSKKILQYEEGKKMPENNEAGASFHYSNEKNEANTSNKNLVYHQKLEPNYCEISSDIEGRLTFKVNSHAPDIQTAIENAVESYNKIAKVINRPTIDLNTVVGSTNSEILTKKNEELLALEKWEDIANNVMKPIKKIFFASKFFGIKLKRRRQSKNIKIYKMATDLGIPKEILLEYERSISIPDKKLLIEIFEYLNISQNSMPNFEKSYHTSEKAGVPIRTK